MQSLHIVSNKWEIFACVIISGYKERFYSPHYFSPPILLACLSLCSHVWISSFSLKRRERLKGFNKYIQGMNSRNESVIEAPLGNSSLWGGGRWQSSQRSRRPPWASKFYGTPGHYRNTRSDFMRAKRWKSCVQCVKFGTFLERGLTGQNLRYSTRIQ